MIAAHGITSANASRGATDPIMDDALRAIRLRFIDSLVARLLRFEDLKQQIASNPIALAPLSEISAMAHKIAGVAETLGFGEIGRSAGWIDAEITKGVRNGDSAAIIWRSVESPLETMLEKLEALLDL